MKLTDVCTLPESGSGQCETYTQSVESTPSPNSGGVAILLPDRIAQATSMGYGEKYKGLFGARRNKGGN